MDKISTIGLDLAKHVFQVQGAMSAALLRCAKGREDSVATQQFHCWIFSLRTCDSASKMREKFCQN